MTKVYLITDEDFEELKTKMDVDPTIAHSMTEQERRFYEEAHRRYVYIIERWKDKVKN